jgi:predicted O-methyltransferase YrrM
MNPIFLRNVPPPLETFDHVALLEFFASWIKPERYLELGVRDGRCFTRIQPHCSLAISVDMAPVPLSPAPNIEIHQMTTDAYLEYARNENLQFDMVFIDADHSYEQSYQDFINVKDLVIEDGFIFFHDTYPYAEYMLDATMSHDCYKTPLQIKKQFTKQFEIVTLPFNPGVTICKKVASKDLPWM